LKNLRSLISSLVALAVGLVVASAGCAGTKMSGASGDAGGGGQAAATGAGGGGTTGAAGTTGASGAAGSNGGTGNGGAGGTSLACGLFTFNPTPKNADILLVLDRSASMQDPPLSGGTTSKWNIVVPTLNAVITGTDSSVLWGMKSFPQQVNGVDENACVAGSVTNKIDVSIAAMNANAVTGGITSTTPDGNGTPTGAAINAAVTYLGSLADPNPKYILLATDGEPSCAAIPGSENTTAAKPYAITAITNAKTAGFPTFVIGIAASASAGVTLGQMGDAGGEVPVNATNPLAPHFYPASDMTTLTAALDSITGQISSCLFPLTTPPPVPNDPTKLGVYLGTAMTKVPPDPGKSNGWAYTDTNDTAVEVYGSWCTMIQAAGAGAVQIKYGCASIDVP
jgi:von Willebrand factor type A domain